MVNFSLISSEQISKKMVEFNKKNQIFILATVINTTPFHLKKHQSIKILQAGKELLKHYSRI